MAVTSLDILRAVMKGDVEKLAEMKNAGAPLTVKSEKEKWGLIHSATIFVAKKVPSASLKFLISSGVDATSADMYGNTPLYYAVRGGHIEAVKILVECGSNVNVSNNDGISPLHQSLLNADVNLSLVEYLLSVGADQFQKISATMTVRDFAEAISAGNSASLVDLFKRYSARA